MNLPGAISSARIPERLRPLLTLVNLHYAGAAILLLLNLYFGIAVFAAWRATSDSGAEALAQQQVALKTAQLQALPLEGLDAKIATATEQSDLFYDRRLPVTYSQVLTELGNLTHAQNIKLTSVRYSQNPILANTPGALTEVRMDASLTGDYRPLMLFINSLERDRMFFLISGLALTGQQGGTVGLRLRLTTYLRPGTVNDDNSAPSDIPSTEVPASDNVTTSQTSAQTTSQTSAQPAAITNTAVQRQVPARSAGAQPSPTNFRPATTSAAPRFTPPPGGPPQIRSANPSALDNSSHQ